MSAALAPAGDEMPRKAAAASSKRSGLAGAAADPVLPYGGAVKDQVVSDPVLRQVRGIQPQEQQQHDLTPSLLLRCSTRMWRRRSRCVQRGGQATHACAPGRRCAGPDCHLSTALQALIPTMFGIYTARGHDELSKVCAQASSAAAPATEDGCCSSCVFCRCSL